MSKSEIVNSFIGQLLNKQQMDWLRSKLIEAEDSGFVEQSSEDMLAEFKVEAHQNGRL